MATARKKASTAPAASESVVLNDADARTEILHRLRRAEGQLRGTYLRMTVCFMTQELELKLTPDEAQKADLSVVMQDVETLLARMG